MSVFECFRAYVEVFFLSRTQFGRLPYLVIKKKNEKKIGRPLCFLF